MPGAKPNGPERLQAPSPTYARNLRAVDGLRVPEHPWVRLVLVVATSSAVRCRRRRRWAAPKALPVLSDGSTVRVPDS